MTKFTTKYETILVGARSIEVKTVEFVRPKIGEGPQPAYLSIATAGGVSCRDAKTVLTSRDFQLALLRQADAELASFERRYHELKSVCRLITKARLQLRRSIQEAEAHA